MSLTTTNLGPLTTPFTPSPDCFSLVNSWDTTRTLRDGTFGLSCSVSTASAYHRTDSAELVPVPTCIPSAHGNNTHRLADIASVYSPGNVCPAGFETACSMTRTGGDAPEFSDSSLWSGLSVGETAIGCCPSGLECYDLLGDLLCKSSVKGATKTVIAMTNEDDCASTTATVKVGGGGRYGSGDRFNAYAPRVVLVRQEGDPTSSAIPNEDDPYYEEPPKGLSGGAKIGIGIGSVIGGVIVLYLALLCSCKCRNSASKKPRPAAEQAQQEGVPEQEEVSEPPPSYETAVNQTSAVDAPQNTAR